jgi:hypothetical protein
MSNLRRLHGPAQRSAEFCRIAVRLSVWPGTYELLFACRQAETRPGSIGHINISNG